MNKRDKIVAALSLIVIVLVCVAASPSFQSFMTSQFATINNSVSIKSGALLTNVSHYGGNLFPSITASRATALDANGGLTNSSTTLAELEFVSGSRSNLQSSIDYQNTRLLAVSNLLYQWSGTVGTNGTNALLALGTALTNAVLAAGVTGTNFSLGLALGNTNFTVAVSNLLFNRTLTNNHFINVMEPPYNAKGDGVTYDTAAFQAALDYGGVIYVPYTTNGYLLNSLYVGSNTFLTGMGGMPRLIFSSTNVSSRPLINATNSINVTLQNLELDGTNNTTMIATAPSTRTGMSLNARGNILVADCNIHGFDNQGIYLGSPTASSATGLVLTNRNVTISRTTVGQCVYGIFADTQKAEYNMINQCSILNCNNGLLIASGNITVMGSTVALNNIGFSLAAGNNDGHGSAIGCMINHNTTPISASGLGLGYSFIGCQIFIGTISITSCTGIQIRGGEIDVTAITFATAGQANYIVDNYCPSNSPNTITGAYGYGDTNGWVYNNPTFNGGWLGIPGTSRALYATATLDFPSTIVQTNANLNITVTGAKTGDIVDLGVPAASLTDNGMFTAVATNNAVIVSFRNTGPSGGLARDPASGVFSVAVKRVGP